LPTALGSSRPRDTTGKKEPPLHRQHLCIPNTTERIFYDSPVPQRIRDGPIFPPAGDPRREMWKRSISFYEPVSLRPPICDCSGKATLAAGFFGLRIDASSLGASIVSCEQRVQIRFHDQPVDPIFRRKESRPRSANFVFSLSEMVISCLGLCLFCISHGGMF